MREFTVVNKYVPRNDSADKATGRAVYGDDMDFRGLLHGRFLRSPIAHGKILNIDTSKARELPGVEAVVTGQDFPFRFGRSLEDEPFLALDVVRYIGEPVVGVAADNEDIAEEALDLIKVEYKQLPAVFDAESALDKNTPIVHPDMESYKNVLFSYIKPGTNVCTHFKVRKGEKIEDAFAKADYLFEHTFTTPTEQACTLEPNVCTVLVKDSGNITLWASTQSAYRLRDSLARALDIPTSKFRVIVPAIGGGFGHKAPLFIEPLGLALAMFTKNRPVRVAFNREDELCHSNVRHSSKVTIKSGVNKDGKIVARKVYAVLDTGAYARTGPTVSRNSGHTSLGPYDIPNGQIDVLCVYTNKVPSGSTRGYGTPQMAWAYESHTDMIASELGIDPLEFRRLNLLRKGSLNATGEKITNIALSQCLDKATREIGWESKKKNKKNTGNIRKGVGLSCIHKATASPSSSTALIKMDKDATITILISTVEMGQGSDTVMAQIAAEVLCLPFEKVQVTMPDTDYTPFDETTSASKATFTAGNAVKNAAVDLRDQIYEIVKVLLEEPKDRLRMKNGAVESIDGSKRIKLEDILSSGYYGKLGGLVGRGSFYSDYVKPLDKDTGLSEKASAFWMYAANCAEVEVDIDTGHVKVLKITAAHDVGTAINRLGCEQQIEGGVIFGLGHALYEELKFEAGRVLTRTLADYKIPTIKDIPEIVPIIVEDAPHEKGPFGAKGVGEPAVTAIIAAIGNAVHDAVGVWIHDLPVTPERVFMALKSQKRIK